MIPHFFSFYKNESFVFFDRRAIEKCIPIWIFQNICDIFEMYNDFNIKTMKYIERRKSL